MGRDDELGEGRRLVRKGGGELGMEMEMEMEMV